MNLNTTLVFFKKLAQWMFLPIVSFLFGNAVIAQNTVSGTVYNDIDGSARGTFFNIRTGTETGTNGNGTLNVYVVSILDIIVATATVAPNGTYTSSNYSALLNPAVYLVLDTVSRSVKDDISLYSSIKMPAAYSNTSPFMTADILTLGTDIKNWNFGIQKNGFLTIPDFAVCSNSDSLFTWYFRGAATNLFTGFTIVENSGTSAKLPFFKVTARYFTNNDTYSILPNIYNPSTYTIADEGGLQPIPTTLQYPNPVLEIGGSSLAYGVNTDSVGISVAFKNTNGQKMYIQKLNNAVLDLDTYESMKVIGYNNGKEVRPIIYSSNGYADNTTNDMRSFYMGNEAWMFGVSSGFQSFEPCNAWCDYNYNSVAIMEFLTPVDSIFYTARITEPTGNRDYLAGSLGSNEITGFNYCPITVKGTLWNDGNGNGIVDANDANVLSSGYYVNMIDEYGKVLLSASIQADGTYTFPNLPQLGSTVNMKLQLSATAGIIGNLPPVTAVPNDYVSVSENQGGIVETGAAVNKEINLPLILGSDLVNYNFGIEKLPETYSKVELVSYPTGGVISKGKVTVSVSGNDAEDGILSNSNTIAITNLPSNATMSYNDLAVTTGQQITGFNPAMISFTDIALGSTTVVFNYAFIDAAGKQDPTPADYTVNWLVALPITIESFTASKENDKVRLSWRTLTEQDISKFILEYSKDGISFSPIAEVKATGSSNIPVNYSWLHHNPETGNNYYRLKIVTSDGKYTYSLINVVKMNNAADPVITVYPNPANNLLNILLPKTVTASTIVNIYSTDGKLVYTKPTGYVQNIKIPISSYANGVYYIRIINDGAVLYKANFIK